MAEEAEAKLPDINTPEPSEEPSPQANLTPPRSAVKEEGTEKPSPSKEASLPRITMQGSKYAPHGSGPGADYLQTRSYLVYTKGKTDVGAGDWKADDDLRQWSKQVDKRKADAAKKKVRQACKDANWVMARRTVQTKNLRDRQKAEEAAARAQEAQAQHTSEVQKKYQNAARKTNMSLNLTNSKQANASDRQRPRASLTHHDDGPLTWRMPPVLEKKDASRVVEEGVWVKAGHFTSLSIKQ